jgi:dihydrofolate reductase
MVSVDALLAVTGWLYGRGSTRRVSTGSTSSRTTAPATPKPSPTRPHPVSSGISPDPPIGRYAANMARLIYSALASLDGYVEDEHGEFAWAAPDAEVLAFVNELERPIGTYLFGRRMYETMVYWETVDSDTLSAESREFTDIWRAADKIVYSRTLQTPSSARTRIEPAFDPASIRQLKESATRGLTVGGAELASAALAAGLVDELHLILNPIIVGGGKPALPDGVRIELELLDERRFKGGAVYLRYRLRA